MSISSLHVRLAALALLAATVAGCGSTGGEEPTLDQKFNAQRVQFTLKEEPADVMGVLDVREEIKNLDQVVVVGRIGGLKNPFSKDRARFTIVDPSVLVHGTHECKDPDCPHCAKLKKQKQLNATAVVEFRDEKGNVMPIDTRSIFGVKAGQTVVVRGRAQLNELKDLVISADGLYIRE